ncbi:MAG: hypothetical protein M5U26_20955 [Planctomycetota bacterium]|nr:hypothetical protein [Planctomycetota bacterium]
MRKGKEPSRIGMQPAAKKPADEPKIQADDPVDTEALAQQVLDKEEVESLLEDLPDEEIEKIAAAEEAREAKEAKQAERSGSSRRSERGKPQAAAASRRGKAVEAKAEEEEEQDDGSSRRRKRADLSERKLATASRRMRGKDKDDKEDKDEGEAPEASNRLSRRGLASASRRSTRGSVREQKPVLSKKAKLGIAAGLLAVIVGAIAYKPVMKSMILSKLDDGANAEAKKSAAGELFNWLGAEALGSFMERLTTERDADVYAAAAHGLGLGAKTPGSRDDALNYIKTVYAQGGPEARLALTVAMESVGEYYSTKTEKGGERPKEALNAMAGLAEALLPQMDAGAEPALRTASLKAANKLVAPGVCRKLIEIAKTDKGELRALALSGIALTATPDACGDLLRNMANKEDDVLAKAAVQGFAKVRDQAKTNELLPLLGEDDALVRLEIVKALATRTNDGAAQAAVVKATADKSKDVRLEAVTAMPALKKLGVDDLKTLAPRITDDAEEVRVATGEALGKLQDETTWALLLGAFQKDLSGKALEAFANSLAVRGWNHNRQKQTKDREALKVGMDLLGKNSALGRKVMVQLTMFGGSAKREAERNAWSDEQWHSWYARLMKRDALTNEAEAEIAECKKHATMEQKTEFEKWIPKAEHAEGLLEQAAALCEPDDREDKSWFDTKLKAYSELRYHLQKNMPLNLNR